MECKIIVLNEEFEPYLINWAAVGKFWVEDNPYYISPDSLLKAYNSSWFIGPHQLFLSAELGFDDEINQFAFKNGRHRTILLSALINEVPVAIHRNLIDSEQFRQIILRPIKEGEYINLPDLEFMSATELRKK